MNNNQAKCLAGFAAVGASVLIIGTYLELMIHFNLDENPDTGWMVTGPGAILVLGVAVGAVAGIVAGIRRLCSSGEQGNAPDEATPFMMATVNGVQSHNSENIALIQ